MNHKVIPNLPATLAVVVSAFAVALSIPPLRGLIERSMLWHMAIQIPLLVYGGWWVTGALAHGRLWLRMAPWNQYGLTGAIAGGAIIAYWMLPSSIDRAVMSPQTDALKLLSLLACGAMLRHSLERSPLFLQLFFVGNTVSMMIWLGVHFATTDLRLCNAYSLESQIESGRAIAVSSIALGCIWLVGVIRQGRGLWRAARSTR